MVDIQVNIVHAEVLKAFVKHSFDMLFAADACADLVCGAGQKFCRYYHFVTLCKVTQRPAKILFTASRLIGNSGIEKVHAKRKSALNDLP